MIKALSLIFGLIGLCLVWGSVEMQAATEKYAVIEGKVALSAPPARRPPVHRYGLPPSQPVESAPPPVAVVYLEGEFELAPPQENLAVIQRGLQFFPGILPVILGTSVGFPNKDEVYHNVFSYSNAKAFDLGRYSQDEPSPIIVFDRPGVIQLFCEVHSHMRGTILVLETPYFTVTDKDGNFRLDGLPTGEYDLVVWHSERQQTRRKVVLKPGEVLGLPEL